MSTDRKGGPRFLDIGGSEAETLALMQKELLARCQDVARQQQARAELAMKLAAELTDSVARAKSIGDLTSAYQKWTTRRLQLFAEDGRSLYDNGQRLVQAVMRMAPNGGQRDGGEKRRRPPATIA